MNGSMIQWQNEITGADPNWIILRTEPSITAGHLIMLDFSHPVGALTSVANGTIVNNVAYETAMALTGATTRDTVNFKIQNNLTPTTGTAEITPKKGIHGIYTKTNDVAGVGFNIVKNGNDIGAYILANPTHQYYVSAWHHVTRGAGITGILLNGISASSTETNCFNVQRLNGFVPLATGNGATLIGGFNSAVTTINTIGDKYADLGMSGYKLDSGLAPNAAQLLVNPFMIGRNGATITAGASLSAALYRYILVDLTVANLTYAQMHALDYAACQTAFGEGGKYALDTYIDPALSTATWNNP